MAPAFTAPPWGGDGDARRPPHIADGHPVKSVRVLSVQSYDLWGAPGDAFGQSLPGANPPMFGAMQGLSVPVNPRLR